jgi:hypothetical protein
MRFCVLNTVPCKTDPQMINFIMGEERCLTYVCIAGKKFCSCFQREKDLYEMHSDFKVNTLIIAQYFQNLNLMTA